MPSDNVLYSFVMPTRDRADVLHYSIRTVLKQRSSNFELVIMDNCSSPATREVVEAFNSPHIRYFRSPERLSMRDNWELALEHASGDYVTITGDDDGVLPDALEVVQHFHKDWPDAIFAWRPMGWIWPDFYVDSHKGFADMYFGSHVEICDSRQFLGDLFASRKHFRDIPTIYRTFVPRSLIEQIKDEQGRYFLFSLPDISSGLSQLASTESFLYCYRPVTVSGTSRHSIGLSQWFDVGSQREDFDRENRGLPDGALDSRLSGEFIIEVRVADIYLKAKEMLFPDDTSIVFDFERFLHSVCQASALRFPSSSEAFIQAVHEMARRNGLDPAKFAASPVQSVQSIPFMFDLVSEKNLVNFRYCTNASQIATIEDFVDYAIQLCVAPAQLRVIKEHDGAMRNNSLERPEAVEKVASQSS